MCLLITWLHFPAYHSHAICLLIKRRSSLMVDASWGPWGPTLCDSAHTFPPLLSIHIQLEKTSINSLFLQRFLLHNPKILIRVLIWSQKLSQSNWSINRKRKFSPPKLICTLNLHTFIFPHSFLISLWRKIKLNGL